MTGRAVRLLLVAALILSASGCGFVKRFVFEPRTTAWDNLYERLDANGKPDLQTALDAFALAFGPLPGTKSPRGDGGFGYDPSFVPVGDTRTVAEMPQAEKNQKSHRAQAMRAFLARFPRSR